MATVRDKSVSMNTPAGRVSKDIRKWPSQYPWRILGTILVLATALRIFHLGAQSFWLDEAYSALIARRTWIEIINSTAQDTQTPLHYFLLHLFLGLNDSDVSARLLSAIFGVLAIPLLHGLATRLFNEKIGMLSALLLAVNPFHVFYSQEARMYSLLGFLSLLAIFFFWRAWQEGKASDWLGFSLSAAAALHTHIMAFLVLVALGIFGLLDWHRAKARWGAWIASMGLIALLFLPWLLYLPGQIARVANGFWVETPSILETLTTLQLFLFGYALPPLLSVAALLVGLYTLSITFLASWRAMRKEKEKRQSLLFLLCLSIIPIASSFLISVVYPIFLARTLIPSALTILVLLAWGLTRIHRPVAIVLVVAGLGLTSISIGNYYTQPAYAKPPIRAAANYVQSHFQPGDTVIHSSDSSYLAFAYYQPDLDRHFPTGDPDYATETTRSRTGYIAGIRPQTPEEIVQVNQRLWLVVTLDHNIEYQQDLERRISGCYPLLKDNEIGGIQIHLYDLTRGGPICP
jgi:mannosyltransferase